MSIGVSSADVSVNEYLTNIAQSFSPKVRDMAVEKLVTPVPIPAGKEEFTYGIWDLGMGYQDPGKDNRADTGKSKKFEDKYSEGTGKVQTYAGHTEVSVKIGKRYPGGLDAYKEVRTKRLTMHAWRARNQRLASLFAYTGMTHTDTPTVKWDATSSTTVFANIKTAKNAVFNQCGEVPNIMAMDVSVAEALSVNAEVIARYAGIDPRVTSTALPTTISDLEVVTLKGQYNTAKKGQTASLGSIWTDNCYIGYVSPIPDPFGLTGAATFRPEDAPEILIREWFDDATQCWIVEYEMVESNIILSQECWYTWYNCLT